MMRAGTRNGLIIGGLGVAIGVVGIWLWLRCRRHHKSHHLTSTDDDLGNVIHEKWDLDCPEWINCMPGPGKGPCKIPKGCEGITKIAY